MKTREKVLSVLCAILLTGGFFVWRGIDQIRKNHEEALKIEARIKVYEDRIDSLNQKIQSLENQFEVDSTAHAKQMDQYLTSIRVLQKRLNESDFKNYNPDDLDSIVVLMHSGARVYFANRNRKVDH